ncbi:polysaccharide deacetylase family protein [Sphingobium aquiterrae]|uniref:polysaccharide deacetylase family protein n=1 Tax=Sphingobium aquiterrae TaxID=2038656 RepID=UPI003018CE0B
MPYPRNWSLPKNERLVFNIGLAFESFTVQSQYTHFQPGIRDPFSLSYGDYGWKAGMWRIFDLLGELGVTATMSTNGLAAEQHPKVVEAAIAQGFEISGHGWQNDIRMREDDPEGELEEIRRCTRVLTEIAGERPAGWISVGLTGTSNTNRLLAQEGYAWNADDASDDIPFLHSTGHGDLVIFPRAGLPMNDLNMWALARNPPSVIWENFKDTFDTLYAEGAAGRPKIIDITLHGHMAGRPTLIPTIRRMISYAQQHEGVWFARRKDVANWVRSHDHPDFTAA